MVKRISLAITASILAFVILIMFTQSLDDDFHANGKLQAYLLMSIGMVGFLYIAAKEVRMWRMTRAAK